MSVRHRSRVDCVLLIIVFLALVVPCWGRLDRHLALNVAAWTTMKALSNDPALLPVAYTALAELTPDVCRANWLGGLVANRLGWEANRDASWEAAIRCSSGYVSMLYAVVPDNQGLAELSVREHPKSAQALFWLAQIRAKATPAEAIELYRSGLQLDPHNSVMWRELGDLLTDRDPQSAIEAYLQSCYNGDFGYHGCYRAGLTAEQQGDITSAIHYYRFSRWSGALERADELEKQRREETAP